MAEQSYPLPEAMQIKLIEKNEAVIKAQAELAEWLEMGRQLSGAPPDAIIGDISMGFVPPPPNKNGADK